MARHVSKSTLIVSFLLVVSLLASCNLPSSNNPGTDPNTIAQTLVALAFTQTAMAQPVVVAATETQPPAPEATNTSAPVATSEPVITHSIMPGNMPGSQSTIDDLLFNSDSFNLDLYERPYTSGVMLYRPDLDLGKVLLGADNTFFYFEFGLHDVNPDTKNLVANYGIEIDVDRDGRGDFLIWANQAPTSTAWDTAGMVVLTDMNNDVGGTRALLSDAPVTGDGYETEIWPGTSSFDFDGAWIRINPSYPNSLQIAVKRSLLGDPPTFLWNAWADDNLKAPWLFDYNDFMTYQQAGSPYQGATYYPLAQLALVDNTCRGAYGFHPSGNEPGYCKAPVSPTNTRAPSQPTATTTKPVTTTAAPCTDVQITAQVTDGSTWDPAWSSGVTLCLDGECHHPDSSGYVVWYRPAGSYTINASAAGYGITPKSASVKLGCGKKSLTQFVIGPP
jgi:hypothetical protein